MSLGEQIEQTTFQSNKEELIINISYTAHWLRDQLAEVFKEYGLQEQHYNVLRIVGGKHPEPASPGQIKKVMLDKKRDLTRLVDKLVKLGYLSRDTCPSNRRKVDIRLTSDGREIIEKSKKILDHKIDQLVPLESEESQLLNKLLDKLRSSSSK